MMHERELLGRHIRTLRKRRGLRGKDLANRAHLSAGKISQIEKGTRDTTLDTLIHVAYALNVPLRDLFPTPQDPHTLSQPIPHELDALLRVAAGLPATIVEALVTLLVQTQQLLPPAYTAGPSLLAAESPEPSYHHPDSAIDVLPRLKSGDSPTTLDIPSGGICDPARSG